MTKTPSLRGGYAEAIQANSSKGTGLPRRCAARNDGGGYGYHVPRGLAITAVDVDRHVVLQCDDGGNGL